MHLWRRSTVLVSECTGTLHRWDCLPTPNSTEHPLLLSQPAILGGWFKGFRLVMTRCRRSDIYSRHSAIEGSKRSTLINLSRVSLRSSEKQIIIPAGRSRLWRKVSAQGSRLRTSSRIGNGRKSTGVVSYLTIPAQSSSSSASDVSL